MSRRSELLTNPTANILDQRNSRHFVESLSRGLDILSLFSREVVYLGNDEISKKTGLPKSTVTRLTFTLTAMRYLVYDPSIKKYKIGPATLAWSYAVPEGLLDDGEIKNFLRDFAEQLECSSVALSVNSGLEMIYVSYCSGPAVVQVRTGIGARLKLWTSSSGRAYWASTTEEQRSQLAMELNTLSADEASKALEKLSLAESEFKSHGLCTSIGDWVAGVNAVGCAVRNPADDSVTYIISCSGTEPRFAKSAIYSDIGPKLIQFSQFLAPRLAKTTKPFLPS